MSTNRNPTLKRLADVVSVIFFITPFVGGAWLFFLFHSSKNGLLSIDSSPILGWLPEIIIIDSFLFMAGFIWLIYRCGPVLSKRYPITGTWQFKTIAMLGPGAVILLLRVLYHIFGGGPAP